MLQCCPSHEVITPPMPHPLDKEYAPGKLYQEGNVSSNYAWQIRRCLVGSGSPRRIKTEVKNPEADWGRTPR
jgi:hypothetical protein